MPIILSESRLNVITCIQLPPAQPMEHFLLNYCFNDSSSELLLPATLHSLQKRVTLIAKSFTKYCTRKKIDDSGRTMQLLHAHRMRNIKRDYLSRAIGNSYACIRTTQCATIHAKMCMKYLLTFKNNYHKVRSVVLKTERTVPRTK
jgi:hypothetical protein